MNTILGKNQTEYFKIGTILSNMEHTRTSMVQEKEHWHQRAGRLRDEYWFCISPSHVPVIVLDQHVHHKSLVKIN